MVEAATRERSGPDWSGVWSTGISITGWSTSGPSSGAAARTSTIAPTIAAIRMIEAISKGSAQRLTSASPIAATVVSKAGRSLTGQGVLKRRRPPAATRPPTTKAEEDRVRVHAHLEGVSITAK
jgi:hypothetical protein